MRYFLILFLGFLSFWVKAQSVESFGSRFIISSDTLISGSDDFYVRGLMRHPRATYSADSVQINDILVDADCNFFTVDSILTADGNYLRLRVTPADTTVNDIRAATGGIIRLNSPPNGTYTLPAGVPSELIDCFINYNFQNLTSVSNLNDLDDVDTTGIVANDLLQWNGADWIMSSPAEVISTIYNADDTITSNRTVEIGANTLAFVSNNAALDAIQFYQVNGSNWNNSSIGYQRLYWDVGDIDSEAYQTIYTTQIRNKVQTPDGYVDYRINDTTADYRLHNVSSDLYALFSPTGFSLSPTTYTTPTAMLDIAGDVRVRSLPSDVAPTGVVTADANGNFTSSTPAQIVSAGGGGYWIKIGVDSIYTLDYVGIGTSELKYTGYVGDVKLRVSGSDSTVLGRTSFIVENNSVSNNSAAAFGLINNVGKGVFVQATSSTYPTPSIGAFYTSNNFDMGFFTDGGLTTGGTSKIYFKAGGYVDEDLTINPDGLVVFEPTSANPTGEAGGQYYDSDNSTMWYHDGTAYRAVVKGDAGSWTSGRIPYSNGSQLTSDADMVFDGYTATISGLKGYQYVSGHEGSVVGMFFNASNPKIKFNLHNGGNESFAQFRSSTGSAWANIGKHSSTGGQGTKYGIALSSGAVGGTGTMSTINGSENLVITTCYNANYSSGNITVVPGTAIHSTNAGSLFLVGGKQDAETTGSVAGLTGQVYIQTYFDHNQQDSATTRRTHMIFSGRNSRITTQLYHLYNYGTPSYVLVMHGDTIKQATPAEIVSAGGAPTGSGAANRVAYWNGTSTLTSNAGFTYDGTDLAVTTGDILVGASTPESVYNYLTGADQGVSSLYVENTGGVSDPIAYFNNPLGIARFNVNSGVGGNSGFGIACLDSIRWTIASYQGGTGKFDFTFYNSQIGEDAMFIDGDNNYITLGSSDTPAAALDIQMTSINLTRENGLRIQISDAGDDQFFIGNGSSTNGRFVPIFGGIVTSYSPAPSVGFRGFHTAAGDISGATAVSIGGMRTSSASNPNNGTWSNLVNARILNVYNYATTLFSVEADGGVTIHPLTGTTPTGSEGMLYADADDNNLYYHDGTAFRQVLMDVDFTNGLTFSSGQVKLGGALTGTTSLTGAYQINISGDVGSAAKLTVTNNGSSGVGISSSTTSGNAFYGVSTNSYAAYLQSTNGYGAFVYSTNNTALYAGVNPSSTNSVVDVMNVQRTTSGTAANGIGGAINYLLQTSGGSTVTAVKLEAIWDDATTATRTSDFVVTLEDSTVSFAAMTIKGDRGIVELNTGIRENIQTEVNSATTATLFNILPVDVSSGTVTISVPTYPAPQAGDWFAVSDSRANAGSNNITVSFTGASVNFHGASADDVISSNGEFRKYTYVNSTVGWIRTN